VRFLADMGISPATVRHLRNLGHDAIHLADEGLIRLSDIDILAKARSERRTVLTVDLDFLQLMALGGQLQPSVITFRTSDKTPTAIATAIDRCLIQFGDLLEQGALLSVGDRTVRARELPIIALQAGEENR
jgi:predicted nuclease of predicted toxin-antitoxin system